MLSSEPEFSQVVRYAAYSIAGAGALYPAYKVIQAFVSIVRWFTHLESRLVNAEEHVVKMATNELPHLQESAEKMSSHLETVNSTITQVNENITGLREDFRTYFLR